MNLIFKLKDRIQTFKSQQSQGLILHGKMIFCNSVK